MKMRETNWEYTNTKLQTFESGPDERRTINFQLQRRIFLAQHFVQIRFQFDDDAVPQNIGRRSQRLIQNTTLLRIVTMLQSLDQIVSHMIHDGRVSLRIPKRLMVCFATDKHSSTSIRVTLASNNILLLFSMSFFVSCVWSKFRINSNNFSANKMWNFYRFSCCHRQSFRFQLISSPFSTIGFRLTSSRYPLACRELLSASATGFGVNKNDFLLNRPHSTMINTQLRQFQYSIGRSFVRILMTLTLEHSSLPIRK